MSDLYMYEQGKACPFGWKFLMTRTWILHCPLLKDPGNKEVNEHVAGNRIFKSKSDGKAES